MFDNYGTYNHIGDNVAGDKIVNQGASQEDWKSLMACVKESGVSKEDINALLSVLQDINASQNDLTTEFAKMTVDWEVSRKTGMLKKLNDRVTLTNGMVTLGKTAIGIVMKNPTLALPGVIEMAKDMVE